MTLSETDRSERRTALAKAVSDRTGIDEEMISRVVDAFYDRVRKDGVLAPIFARVLGTNWNPHLAKMYDFWSSVILTTGRYKGNPMVAHMRLKTIKPQHFDRWLDLFRQTVVDVCPPEAAVAFVMRADNIARSLQWGMFFRPEDHPLGSRTRKNSIQGTVGTEKFDRSRSSQS